MTPQITNAFRSRQTISPRSVLGYFATVLASLLTASIPAIAILASHEDWSYLIPWILIFDAAVVLLLIAGPFIVAMIDPSKLMLTHVTGTEYAVIQQGSLVGDSRMGEVQTGTRAVLTEDAPTIEGNLSLEEDSTS